MGRRWIGVDLSLTYVLTSSFRFELTPGFRTFAPEALIPHPAPPRELFTDAEP
jgi:hypothetical protein